MLRRHRQIRMQIHQLMDACLFAVSFWLAFLLRSNDYVREFLRLNPAGDFESFVWLYLILIPAAPLILEAQGFYNRPMLCPRRATLWILFKACLITTVGLIMVLFFGQIFLPRSVVPWFGVISFVMVFAKEELVRLALKSRLAQSQYRRRFILVGSSEETRRMRNDFQERSQEEVEILAELDLSREPVERLIEMLHEYSVNGVILSARHSYFEQMEAAIRACELEGVEAWLVADFFKTQISRTSFDDFYGRPVLVFRSTPEASWQGVLKQVLDVLGALVLLIILSPVLALIALVIRITSPGPVLFRQLRSGLNGRPFTIYKFRTMVTNAEQMQHELAAMNEMSGPVFKVTKDPPRHPCGPLASQVQLRRTAPTL
jgi:Sugar transferases involved in lipopolysaccharide synthesis